MTVRINPNLPDDHRLAGLRGVSGHIASNISENDEARVKHDFEFYPEDSAIFVFVNAGEFVTDHSEEIKSMRGIAQNLRERFDNIDRKAPKDVALRERSVAMAAAADLLELHDRTGISLDNMGATREFVETFLGEPIVENHV